MERSLLKRCVSVVIQRLARSSSGWTVDVLKGKKRYQLLSFYIDTNHNILHVVQCNINEFKMKYSSAEINF